MNVLGHLMRNQGRRNWRLLLSARTVKESLRLCLRPKLWVEQNLGLLLVIHTLHFPPKGSRAHGFHYFWPCLFLEQMHRNLIYIYISPKNERMTASLPMSSENKHITNVLPNTYFSNTPPFSLPSLGKGKAARTTVKWWIHSLLICIHIH